MRWVISVLALSLTGAPSFAGEADIVAGEARQNPDGTWRVSATVRHADTGWEHYADRFDVLSPDGTVLAERVLLHPHVNEQPFTRSVTATIPEDIAVITLRAHDNVDGLGGATFEITLER